MRALWMSAVYREILKKKPTVYLYLPWKIIWRFLFHSFEKNRKPEAKSRGLKYCQNCTRWKQQLLEKLTSGSPRLVCFLAIKVFFRSWTKHDLSIGGFCPLLPPPVVTRDNDIHGASHQNGHAPRKITCILSFLCQGQFATTPLVSEGRDDHIQM